MPPALADDHVVPQERTLADDLVLLSEVARHVVMVDRQNRPAGNWRPLFEDVLCVLAEIVATDVRADALGFAEALDTDATAAAREVVALARRARTWIDGLERAGFDTILARLDAMDDGENTRELIRAIAEAGDSPAEIIGAAGASVDYGTDPVQRAVIARRELAHCHDHLGSVAEALRPAAAAAFAQRIASGRIDPALGLVLAELKAFEAVKERMNTLTARHTSFYYRDVLGQAPRRGSRGTVHVVVTPGIEPNLVPEDAELVAEVPGESGPRRYRLKEDLRVVPMRIGDVRMLRYDRDARVLLSATMNYVTGVRSAVADIADTERAGRLFSPERHLANRVGLCVESPMLCLAEGRRRIRVSLAFADRRPPAPVDVREKADPAETLLLSDAEEGPRSLVMSVVLANPGLVAAFGFESARKATDEVRAEMRRLGLNPSPETVSDQVYHALLSLAETSAQARAVFGRIAAASLLEGHAWPSGTYRELLFDKLVAEERTRDAEAAEETERELSRLMSGPPSGRFHQLLADGFQLSLSSEAGTIPLQAVAVSPKALGTGLVFDILLDDSAPAILAPAGAEAPALSIALAPEARFSAVSLVEPFAVESIEIEVEVDGLKRLTGYSDAGALDTTQPFAPFGIRPRGGAHVLLGAPELAMKPVTSVGLTVTWADLPKEGDGFAEHYRHYGRNFTPPDPQLTVDYLTGEGWQRLTSAPVSMLPTSVRTGLMSPTLDLDAPIRGRPRVPHSGISAADFRERSRIRAGLLRLSLDAANDAFGHNQYPVALSRAMRPRLIPHLRRPVPLPPYTPTVAAVELRYSARTTIFLSAPDIAMPGERVTQLSPFGTQEIYPARTRPGAGLFPPRLADGTLYLRLDGRTSPGRVTLLFEMSQGKHRRTAFQPGPIAWHYLTDAGWTPMPPWAIASDTTDAMMRTGIVTLEIPANAVTESTEMPGTGLWLAVAANANLDDFPHLVAIHVNGARAERIDQVQARADAPHPTGWRFDPPRLGLGEIRLVEPERGVRAPEGDRDFRIRIAEHLRHRQRGVTAWDIERLVLEAFPEVWKAKCFSRGELHELSEDAAQTIVVVVPHAPAGADRMPSAARTFDVVTLGRVQEMLESRVSPFTRLQVRNPAFERLQVRAVASFSDRRDTGALMQRLVLDVSRFLSVWTADTPRNGFGWSVGRGEVGAYMASLPYVAALSNLSLLHLIEHDDGIHRLHDTARGGRGENDVLSWREPWSLPLPMAEQWVSAAIHDLPTDDPSEAGIGGLRVGRTLVVTERTPK